jgi:hypothetical protein
MNFIESSRGGPENSIDKPIMPGLPVKLIGFTAF